MCTPRSGESGALVQQQTGFSYRPLMPVLPLLFHITLLTLLLSFLPPLTVPAEANGVCSGWLVGCSIAASVGPKCAHYFDQPMNLKKKQWQEKVAISAL